MEDEEEIIVNGVKLWCCRAGRGPVLIAQCPGWGTGAAYLPETIGLLEQHCSVLYYDTRGSGRSERPDNSVDISVGHMARDLEALRIHFQIPALTLLGHSHGAYIALNYVLKYPQCVRALILIAPQLGAGEVREDVARNLPALLEDVRYREAAQVWKERSLKTDEEFTAWMKRVFPLYFYDPRIAEHSWSKMHFERVACATCRAVTNSNPAYEVRPHLHCIQTPTLILVGAQDFITSPIQATLLHNGLANSRLVIVERCGHFPWLEQTDTIFSEIIAFIREQADSNPTA